MPRIGESKDSKFSLVAARGWRVTAYWLQAFFLSSLKGNDCFIFMKGNSVIDIRECAYSITFKMYRILYNKTLICKQTKQQDDRSL